MTGMADSQRTVQPWTDPPEAELRRVKTMVEDELLIKLGAKKEAIEFHPLILAQRPERPKSSVVPDYRRVKPPRQEKQQPNRNPWRCSDQALRQLTNNPTRQGPRQIQLPSASNRKTVNLRTMPACDEEYRKLRLVKLSKRDEILAEWPVYQSQAYLLKRLTFFVVPDTDELRRFSLVSSTSSIAGPEKKSAHPRPARRVLDHLTQPTLRKRPRARWRGMARQVLWNTKAAQMRMPEEIPRSEVRIYVSCTEDMSEEREFLAEVAYPELRRFCEKHGLGCHVVDLRHGINRLKNDRETFDVIDYEVKKCQQYSIGPSFVSIIGREADDRHLPGWMSKDDVLAVRSVLVKCEDVVAVEALDNIYRLDSNYNPPLYLLEESQFFAETAETKVLQNVLPDVLNLLRGEGKVKDSKGFYPWSSTVREVERGLLKCLEPNRQTICLMARADNKSDTDITASTGDLGADKLRAAVSDCYKFTSSKSNLVLFNIGKKNVAYLREVCAVFLAAVTRLIESQIGHHEFDITHHMTNAADLVQHVRVARRACDGFIGCEQAVQRICDLFTDASAPRVAVVAGPEGRGKTSLVGHAAAVLSLAAPRRKLVFRTIGITLSSSTLFHTLSSVYAQVAYLYEISPHLPADINLGELLQEFRNLLQKAREKFRDKGFFVLILDGVDKLRGLQAKQLSFLVASIPAGVALLMSMSDFGPLYETMKVFANIEMIHCEPMKSDYLNSYINSFLARCGRVLKNDQVKAILNELTEENEPLVAKIAASMASRWPSHTLNDDLDISSDMEKAFNRLVQSCEVQLGLKFTRYSLSLLAASRYGLAEFEILHLISSDSELIDEIKEEIEDLSVVEGCPYQLQLSRLLWRLDPFLFEVKTEGETILKISHRTLEKVVRERFMRDGFQYHIHSRLATYFQITRRGHLLSSRDIAEGQHKDLSRYLWRTLRSVPYHLCHSHPDPKEAWKVLKSAVFTKFAWIINEIYAGFFNDFIDDMNYALETLGLDSEVLFLRQFLTSVRKTIIFNPVSLASLMAGQDLKEMAEVHRSVTEATDWLKQVNVQVLVPAAFTVEKASQLLLNTALLKTVNTLVTDAKGERVLAQHDIFLTSVEPISGEETVVASFSSRILSTHLWGSHFLTVLTTSPTGKFVFDTYALDKGKQVGSVQIEEANVTWYQVRSDGFVFYAVGNAVKRVVLEKGNVIEQFKTPETIVDACVSEPLRVKVITLHTSPKTMLRVFDAREPTNQGKVYLQNKTLNTNAVKLLAMTRDSTFVVVMCEREVLIVDLSVDKVTQTLTFNNVPVILSAFSRSNEHVFVVTPTHLVQCFKLSTGAMVMNSKLQLEEQHREDADTPQASSRDQLTSRTGSKTPASASSRRKAKGQREKDKELVSTVVTSEDDHFLLAGTSLGRMFVLHVPTGLQVCVLTTSQSQLQHVTYFTSAIWFQHVVTVDAQGLVKLWNLRPLVTRARTLVMDIITDNDLLNEEEKKLDLRSYFKHYQERWNDRMFLNGPDISSFYKKPPPADIFNVLDGMDPSLKAPSTWQSSCCLSDCTDVCAVSSGSSLNEVIFTATSCDLLRWSLQDGSLLSVQSCPFPGEYETLRPVYYDKAFFVVVKKDDFKTAAVLYPDDKHNRVLRQEKVASCQVSSDGATIALVPSDEQTELTITFWNVLSSEHQGSVTLVASDTNLAARASSMVFSPELGSCCLLTSQDKEPGCTLHQWMLSLTAPTAHDRRHSTASRGDPSAAEENRAKVIAHKTTRLCFVPTAVCCCSGSNVIALGTTSGLTLMVSAQTLTLKSVLTAEGVEPASDEPLVVDTTWSLLVPPVWSEVTGLESVPDTHVLVVRYRSAIFLWDLQQNRQLLSIILEGDEFLHYCVSRNCLVLCYATSGHVVAMWSVKERRELCSYRLPHPATSLVMTPDCRRLAVIQNDGVTSRVRVFEVRNIEEVTTESEAQREQNKAPKDRNNVEGNDLQ